MSKRLSRTSGVFFTPHIPIVDKESYEREIASQIKGIKNCTDENLLTDVASCFQNDVRVRLAACEKIVKSANLEYLLWSASIEPTHDNCQVTVAVAKKCNVHSLVNSALRPVLLTVECGWRFHKVIEEAIPMVTDVKLLEEFINLAKICSKELEMLAYERAIEIA